MKDALVLVVAFIAAITLAACDDDKKKPTKAQFDRSVWFKDDVGRNYFRPVDQEKIEVFEEKGIPVDKEQAEVFIKEKKEDQKKMPTHGEVYSHTPDRDFKDACTKKDGVVRKVHGGKWVCRYPIK